MKTTHFLLATLLLISLWNISLSQNNYKKGYIITAEADTLSGYINDLKEKKKHTYTLFKQNLKEKPTEYRPDDIIGYGFDDGRIYESQYVELDNGEKGKFFLKVLERGEIYLAKINKRYWFQKGDQEAIELYKTTEQVRMAANGERTEKYYNNTVDQYKHQLNIYFQDCLEVVDQLDDSFKYDDEAILGLIADYRNCKNYPAPTYLAPEPNKSWELEFRVGVLSARTSGDFLLDNIRIDQQERTATLFSFGERNKTFTARWGTKFELRSRFFVDKLDLTFFDAGLSYSSISAEEERMESSVFFENRKIFSRIDVSSLGIPLGLGHRFHFGNVKVDLAGGVSFQFVWDELANREVNEIEVEEFLGAEEGTEIFLEDHVLENDFYVAGWLELSCSPVKTSFGRLIVGVNGQIGETVVNSVRQINESDFNGFQYRQLNLFAGFRWGRTMN